MKKPLHVLQMIGSLNMGGSQSMLINLLRAMDRNEIQFDFILDRPDQLYYKETVEALGSKVYFMPAFTGYNLRNVKKAWNTFFDNHPEYTVLHTHVRSYASVFLPVAKKHGVKTVAHSHSTSNGTGLTALAKRVMQLPLARQADRLMACSTEAGEWLFGKKAVQSDRFFILKNAVDLNTFRYDPHIRSRLRKELGLAENTVVYIHVGRFHPSKNHAFLIELFSKLQKNAPAALLLAGEGEESEKIRDTVCRLGLSDSVYFLGNRGDVPELLQAADCFLLPSLWEGFPLTAVEAQAAGLPCFLSDRITREAGISDSAHFLPVDRGVKPWADAVSRAVLTRRDVSDQIRNAGYDSETVARWLCNFYRGLAKL